MRTQVLIPPRICVLQQRDRFNWPVLYQSVRHSSHCHHLHLLLIQLHDQYHLSELIQRKWDKDRRLFWLVWSYQFYLDMELILE